MIEPVRTLRLFFGSDTIAFDLVCGRFPGTPAQTRRFDRFSHALEEVIDVAPAWSSSCCVQQRGCSTVQSPSTLAGW